MNLGPAALGVLIAPLLLATACFYVPPLEEAPLPMDTPPFILGFEPLMAIDLHTARDVRFGVDAVYDFNLPEDISWGIRLHLTTDAMFPTEIASGRLRARTTQSFSQITEYDGFTAVLDACGVLDVARGNGSVVPVELVLRDPLPLVQRREGFEEHRVVYTWRVRVTGECP